MALSIPSILLLCGGNLNIFLLDTTPTLSAQALCNKHVSKMAVEAAQIASTAHAELGFPYTRWRYLPAYPHHPCTRWAGECPEHLAYTIACGLAICEEYGQRYHKRHACLEVLERLESSLPTICAEPAEFAVAIKAPLRRASYSPRLPLAAAIAEYRAYYYADKADFAIWPEWRGQPAWWPGITD